VAARIFFEDVIRENLDIGRPKQVQLIFDRGVTKTTPGSFRTRVITDGVIPSLHIDYKGTRIKQYHKEGRALRTETTINNTRDFYIGKSLRNLPTLRQIGFAANPASWKSRPSRTTAFSRRRPSSNSIAPASWTTSGSRLSASPIRWYKQPGMHCCYSICCPRGSPTMNYEATSPRFWVNPLNDSLQDA
jgi:hypothetical protein